MIAILKLTLIFAGVVFLIGRKWNLGLVLLLASAMVTALFNYTFIGLLQDIWGTLTDALTLRLILAVVLIMLVGELLRQTASMQRMVTALQVLIPNGLIVIASLPALIGLLPMVGGAMFSAPMVEEIGDQLHVDQEGKTFINYWFRHIWESVFPLYPSLMLGAAMLGIPTTQIFRFTWPLFLAAIAGGVIFGLWGLPSASTPPATVPSQGSHWHYLQSLASSIWPVVMIIVLSLTLPIDERFTLITAIVVTLAVMIPVQRISTRTLLSILRERIPWGSVAVIFGALAFRRVLESSGAVIAVSNGLTDSHVPTAAVAFGLPFISGLLTGLMAAGYSIGFSVALPLVTPMGGPTPAGWAVWLLAGGLVGAMMSPVHLCLGLTRVYFRAEWGPIYRRLLPASLLLVGTAALVLLWSGPGGG